MGESSPSSYRHIPELDSIRGLAAVGVVFFHAFPKTLFFGWSLVDCFFVLSGYLITTILLGRLENWRDLTIFYGRRILRIWPVYYFTLILVLICNAFSRTGYSTDGLVQHLLFLQHIQGWWKGSEPQFIGTFCASWSVAVEEQFYLVWPLLLLLLGRRGVLPLSFLLLVASVAARHFGFPNYTLLYRGDGIALGCALAFLLQSRARRWLPIVFFALTPLSFSVVCILGCLEQGNPETLSLPTLTVLAYALLYFSAIGMCVYFSGHPLLSPLRLVWLRRVSLLSYSMYMLNIPVAAFSLAALRRMGITDPLVTEPLMWAGLFVAPLLTYWWVEKPSLSLKRYLPYGEAA